MRTSKSISTISYNTPKYLEYILNKLLDNDIISFWAYIYHFKESNETKDHIHLYLEPSNRIDTALLRKDFEEIDVLNSENKPLSVMPFNSSHFKDWYLYSMHDIDYLRSKCLTREVYYSRDNFVVSDFNYFLEKINTIDYNFGVTGKVIEYFNSGKSLKDLILSGAVKINQIHQVAKLYDILIESKREKSNKSLLPKVEQLVKNCYVQCEIPSEIDDIFNDIE